MKKCEKCGTANETVASFCASCGEKLAQDQNNAESIMPSSTPLGNNFSNKFGRISGDSLTFFNKKGLLNGGAEKNVSLGTIVSVNFMMARAGQAIKLLIVGGSFTFIGFSSAQFQLSAIGLLLLFPGIIFLWGLPTITINIGGNAFSMRGWSWEKAEAQEFVQALNGRLIKR